MFSRCFAVALLGSLAVSCGTTRSYPLNTPAAAAPGYFAPLGACATQKGLTFAQHPSSLNVRFDAQIWIQYMVQGAAFNMVLVMDQSVTDEAKIGAAKAKGDEIYSCAMAAGPTATPAAPAAPAASEAAPTATSAPTTTAAPTTPAPTTPSTTPSVAASSAPTGVAPKAIAVPELPAAACPASTKPCKSISDCVGVYPGANARCTNGFCWKMDAPGCPCAGNTDCGYGMHCGKGVCHPNKAGAPCAGKDQGECGFELHCGGGVCVPNKSGYACTQVSDCGLTSSCVNNVCN